MCFERYWRFTEVLVAGWATFSCVAVTTFVLDIAIHLENHFNEKKAFKN